MRKAFSLVEIMGVIVLLGLLIVLGYKGFNQTRHNSHIDIAENDLRDFANSFSSYSMDYGAVVIEADANYQTAIEQIVDTLNRQYLSNAVMLESVATDRKSCVLTTKTKRDPWNGKYFFRINTYKDVDGGLMVVSSNGVNGIDESAGYANGDYGDDIIAVVQMKS